MNSKRVKSMSLEEQSRAVYSVLSEHFPELGQKYASVCPAALQPDKDQKNETKQSIPISSEEHGEFSNNLLEIIQRLIDEQREGYKRHLKEQRELFERSDLAESASHRQMVSRLQKEIQQLKNSPNTWTIIAVISWIVALSAVAVEIFLRLPKISI